MTTPQKTIIDCVTGEIVVRDFNDAELAQIEADKAQAKLDAKAVADKQAARQAVLDKIGLSADEAAALLG
jgi:hypothetical protein